MRCLTLFFSLGLLASACKGMTPTPADDPATPAADTTPAEATPAPADDDDSADAAPEAPADDDSADAGPADPEESDAYPHAEPEPISGGTIAVTSTAFEAGAPIPADYTCDGEDMSPPLEWGKLPEATRAVALIMDDPDAPKGTWVHWTVFNMTADTNNMPENAAASMDASDGTQGTNSWSRVGWGGPCPPKGPAHRYYFRVYALDNGLDLDATATRAQLDAAMKGHVLAEGWFLGTYARK